ncbi:MAG TPA: FGGY-family carbohydrate kinase [Gemmataceae bacterium]|nr:FGGY-family carbohydrate kinase [Gemmataceae bacterium]
MVEPLRCVPANRIVAGWDFSTGAVKCLAFDLDGNKLAEVRLPTDLWTEGGVSELNLMQLEGQAMASLRVLGAQLGAEKAALWIAAGISATHHTAGRIDENNVQVRRAICWNDHSLAPYHARGLERLGGQDKVIQAIGGPWAIRYTLSHLVKDEEYLPREGWKQTRRMLPHGPLAAGFLTGNFDAVSVSAAASTGIMNLRTRKWSRFMLGSLQDLEYRQLAWKHLPVIVDANAPLGELLPSAKMFAQIARSKSGPLIFPTSDDQAAGLVGGGAVDAGQMAIVMGNSAVVNSSSSKLPSSGTLDAMRLNWGPYLWMRCYNNGAQFLDRVLGPKPDWERLEREARACPPGTDGVTVLPFIAPEPSLGVSKPRLEWRPREPKEPGKKFRASLEALAYLIARGVREHEEAGQKISRITVSGGIARSDLMCEILATVLDRPLERLESAEGPALGAAVTALAAYESYQRQTRNIDAPYTVADAVARLVKFRTPVAPNPAWRTAYREGLQIFLQNVSQRSS